LIVQLIAVAPIRRAGAVARHRSAQAGGSLTTMRIAQVAPLYESVPPRLYGGTERVVSYLTEELVRLGHDVTLFATGDSVTRAKLRPIAERALRLDSSCIDPLVHHMRMVSTVYRSAADFDVIHCHTDYLGLPLAELSDTPSLITLHGRLDIPELAPMYAEHPRVPLVSISDAQRAPMPRANWLATVHHGLPENLYTFQSHAKDYLLFVGRISPEKRVDRAIRVAQRAGVPLRIAAKVDRVDTAYFEREIEPLLDAPGVEFVGEVGDREKDQLLGGAVALMLPIDWPEPFGLVVIEALACGTPVIACPRGSIPELLQDGETGLIAQTEDDMVNAVRRIGQLDRRRCRREFEQRFTARIMAERYAALYRQIIRSRGERFASTSLPMVVQSGLESAES
jgi:glycosyltransferase involved in cell wall biosynthesis